MDTTAISDKEGRHVQSHLKKFFTEPELREYYKITEQYRLDWVSGRIALKKAYLKSAVYLSRVSDFHVEKDISGKPYFPNEPNLYCSISHSYGYGFAGVSFSPIGLDVERIRTHKPDLLDYIATPREISTLKDIYLDSNELTTAIWVAKESVMKALGTGLRLKPKQIVIHSDTKAEVLENEFTPSSFWNIRLTKQGNFYFGVARGKLHEELTINWYQPSGLQVAKA